LELDRLLVEVGLMTDNNATMSQQSVNDFYKTS